MHQTEDAPMNRMESGTTMRRKPLAQQAPRQPVLPLRTPTTDIRKRMEDVYNEMEQNARSGRIHLPLKFADFHRTDVLYQFARAAVGYALAYVKVQTLEKDYAEQVTNDELAKFHASQSQHHDFAGHTSPLSSGTGTGINNPQQTTAVAHYQHADQQAWQQRIQDAVVCHGSCTTQLSETYSRLVLHCSNFEHHKEDERFFECVFFFICSVVKIGLPAEYWVAVEDELGFLFRGAQFSATIKMHTSTKTQREQAAASAAAASAASDLASGANSAAKKIQNLSAAGGSNGKDTTTVRHTVPSLFELPDASTPRCCYFSASLPVGKIVSELDAAKLRATRNIEISQSIRDHIQATRDHDQRRRHLDAITSPRVSLRVDSLQQTQQPHQLQSPLTIPLPQRLGQGSDSKSGSGPGPGPRRRPHVGSGSPRMSMRGTFTSRSPAVNHLLPGTEDRVRLALEEYERSFQQKLSDNKTHQLSLQHQRAAASPTDGDLSNTVSPTVVPFHTPTKPPPR